MLEFGPVTDDHGRVHGSDDAATPRLVRGVRRRAGLGRARHYRHGSRAARGREHRHGDSQPRPRAGRIHRDAAFPVAGRRRPHCGRAHRPPWRPGPRCVHAGAAGLRRRHHRPPGGGAGGRPGGGECRAERLRERVRHHVASVADTVMGPRPGRPAWNRRRQLVLVERRRGRRDCVRHRLRYQHLAGGLRRTSVRSASTG